LAGDERVLVGDVWLRVDVARSARKPHRRPGRGVILRPRRWDPEGTERRVWRDE
jgi:hypothetical protein